MTMIILRIVSIHKPLLHLIVLSNLHGRQKGKCMRQRVLIQCVPAKHLGGKQCGVEGIKGNLVVHRASGCDGGACTTITMFGRHRRHSDEPSILRMLHEMTHIEISRAFEHRIILAQEVLVASEEIVLPQMLRSPCASIGPHTVMCAIHWSGYSPKVGVVVSHPSLGTI